MNNLRNNVQLIGHVGLAPEVTNFDNDRKLARFSVATNEYYTNKDGEKVTQTYWHTIVAWGKQAELVEKLLEKGKEVALSGKLVNRSYETKDGDKKYITEVELREFLLLGKKENKQDTEKEVALSEDGLPF